MQQFQRSLFISTRGKALYEFTPDVQAFLRQSGLRTGLLTLFCRHTSASLLIQENADRSVQSDLLAYFEQLAPETMPFTTHKTEGSDDMPAHIRTALTQTSLSIPVMAGEAVLGTWQGIYLFEHRAMPHRREVVAHFLGEAS